jgi:hypothetical protein
MVSLSAAVDACELISTGRTSLTTTTSSIELQVEGHQWRDACSL